MAGISFEMVIITQLTQNICITFVRPPSSMVQRCTNVIHVQMYCVYWEYATEAADLTAGSLIQIVVWSFILILI